MAKLRGGMDFRSGTAVTLPPPPDRAAGDTLRITCPGPPTPAEGRPIAAGDRLYTADHEHAPHLTCPIAATVDALIPWPGADDPRVDVVLTPTVEAVAGALALDPPSKTDPDAWREALRDTGPWPQPRLGPDLVTQLRRGRDRPLDRLICVGLDNFPPYPDRSSIIKSFLDDVILGTQILGQIAEARRAYLIIDPKIATAGRLRPICRSLGVRLRTTPNVYPCADPTMLIHQHGGGRRKLPHGADPTTVGVALVTPWTAARIARWLTRGKLDLLQPVLLAWPSPGRVLTPLFAFPGQPLAMLDPALAGRADELANRAVFGDPMTGHAPDAPIRRGQRLPPTLPHGQHLISVLPAAGRAPVAPCISCGWCVDVCPTRLRPIHLVQRLERQADDPDARRHLDYCIDCGLCSHVCPSSIPIAQTLRELRSVSGELRTVNDEVKRAE